MPNPFKAIKEFFLSLQTKDHSPHVERTHSPGTMSSIMQDLAQSMTSSTVTEDQHRKNIEMIELARLDQEREITNNNLKAQHRVLIMTTVATLIALFSSVSAILIAINHEAPKPPVINVAPSQPDVNVYVPEPKPVEQPPQPKP